MQRDALDAAANRREAARGAAADDLAFLKVMVREMERRRGLLSAGRAAMRIDAEREERAVLKLGEAGYTVRTDGAGYIAIRPAGAEIALADLAALVRFADAMYERIGTRRKITPSA